MDSRINKNKYSGFILMEMMVAVFLFALIVTVIISVFMVSFRTQNYSEDFQRDLENVRVAMEAMAKNIRTSGLDDPTSSGSASAIYFYDYSQEKCIGYKFISEDGAIVLKFAEEGTGRLNAAGNDVVNCKDELPSDSFSDFLSGTKFSSAEFRVRRTTQEKDDKDNGYMGQVTILMKLEDRSLPFETTVSLRDY